MFWVFFAIFVFVAISICFFVLLLKKSSSAPVSASAPDGDKAFPVSKKPINFSAFDPICKKVGKIDFAPLSEEDNTEIKTLLSEQKPIPPILLKRNPPIKIAYTDFKGEKTIRDMIPNRIIGSIDVDHDTGIKEYDFYIEAYCLLRKQERSFHINGISAAWYHGRQINLGDHLATLYQQCV
jgi:hypothetical protein